MRIWSGVLLAFLLLTPFAAPAGGPASPPPTLSAGRGETFAARPPYAVAGATLTCPTAPAGTATFTVRGDADGPYPGTFTETVTVSVANNHVSALTATFRVAAHNGTVAGTATLAAPATGDGMCDLYTLVMGAPTTYTATITMPWGTFHDIGTSQLVGELLAPSSGFVDETFKSSAAP